MFLILCLIFDWKSVLTNKQHLHSSPYFLSAWVFSSCCGNLGLTRHTHQHLFVPSRYKYIMDTKPDPVCYADYEHVRHYTGFHSYFAFAHQIHIHNVVLWLWKGCDDSHNCTFVRIHASRLNLQPFFLGKLHLFCLINFKREKEKRGWCWYNLSNNRKLCGGCSTTLNLTIPITHNTLGLAVTGK